MWREGQREMEGNVSGLLFVSSRAIILCRNEISKTRYQNRMIIWTKRFFFKDNLAT